MSVRTVLISFKLQVPNIELILNSVQSILKEHFPSLVKVDRVSLGESNDFVLVYSTESAAAITFTLRYYHSEQLFTLNGEASKSCDEFGKFNNFKLENLQNDLEERLKLDKMIERLPVLRRNSPVPLYFYSSDHRIQQYDFDKVVVHDKSKFQDIKILHSPTLGNTLVLDGIPNMSDADLSYTRALMNYGKNDFKDKKILILGGGDGGLLHELLKENPKFVTMVDIDGVVIDHCRMHLRGVCGSVFDKLDGPNYQVIVGDAIAYMQQCAQEGTQFDFVFGDLTDLPCSLTENKDFYQDNGDEMWNFVTQILQLAWTVLRDGTGKYLTHANGVGSPQALVKFEGILNTQLPGKVAFTSHTCFVPSFIEDWVFYEICKV